MIKIWYFFCVSLILIKCHKAWERKVCSTLENECCERKNVTYVPVVKVNLRIEEYSDENSSGNSDKEYTGTTFLKPTNCENDKYGFECWPKEPEEKDSVEIDVRSFKVVNTEKYQKVIPKSGPWLKRVTNFNPELARHHIESPYLHVSKRHINKNFETNPSTDKEEYITLNHTPQPLKSHEGVKFTASLYVSNKPRCTSVLISNNYALSPCTFCTRRCALFRSAKNKFRTEDMDIRYTKFENFDIAASVHKIEDVVCHPEVFAGKGETYRPYNDLAVLRIRTALNLNTHDLALLPGENHPSISRPEPVLLNSFLYFDSLKNSHNRGHWEMWSNIVGDSKCQRFLISRKLDDSLNFCVKYQHKPLRNDKCVVDNGAAVSLKRDNRYVLVGLIVYKKQCGNQHPLAAGVHITPHVEWIRKITAQK